MLAKKDYKKIHQDFTRERLSPHFVYESYDAESSLFYNRGSIGFVLIANPLPGAEITAETEIADFIGNPENLPEGSSFQVLMIGTSDINFLLNRWLNERKGEMFQELGKRRCEFLAAKAKNDGLIKDSHLLISVTVPDTHACALTMERRREALQATFESIGLWTESVDGALLLSFLRRIWGNKPREAEINPYEVLAEQILAPDFGLYEDNDIVYLNDDQAFICLEPADRPATWTLGLMDLFLGNEMRRGEYIQTDYMIHVGVHMLSNQTMEKAGAIAKREAILKNIKAGMEKFFPDLPEEAEDMQEAVAALQSGGRMMHLHHSIIIKGDKSKVPQAAKSYVSMMRRSGWELVPARYDHLAVMLASMPMALVEEKKLLNGKKVEGIGVALENIGRGKKTVSTETKALLPIIGEYKGDLNAPGMLLTGRRGQLKYWSQFGSELVPHLGVGRSSEDNYNVAIAGISGSGKSVFMQENMLSVLGVGGKVFVFDYGKSFRNLCHELRGNYIEFNPSRPISINPFSEVPTGNDKLSTEARSDFLATFPITLGTMAAPKHGTNDLQQTILTEALRECWERKGPDTQIDDIAAWCLRQDKLADNEVGRMLLNYTQRGAYGGFFAGKAELTLNADIVVIETDHLRNYPDLMAVVVQSMISHINHNMAKGKADKPNLMVFEEIAKTLQSRYAVKFVKEIMRIVRKYYASVMVATQLVTDFEDELGTDGTSIFAQTEHKIIFKQNAETLNKMRGMPLFKRFVDTDARLRRMSMIESKKGEYGEFTIWGPRVNGDIARLRLDPFTLLLMSTNPTDKAMIASYRDKGLDLAQSINSVLRDRGYA